MLEGHGILKNGNIFKKEEFYLGHLCDSKHSRQTRRNRNQYCRNFPSSKTKNTMISLKKKRNKKITNSEPNSHEDKRNVKKKIERVNQSMISREQNIFF